MQANKTEKWYKLSESKNTLTWVALILAHMIATMGSGIENSWFNTFVFENITPDPQAVAWLVSASAITAALAAMVGGAASDRCRSRWGRRRPFLVFGFLVSGVFCILFPFGAAFENVNLAVCYVVAADALMMVGFGAAFDGVLSGYVTDVTTVSNRGRVQSVLQIVNTVATLIVSVIGGVLIEAFGYTPFFVLVGAMLLLNGIVGGLMLPDKPVMKTPEDENRKSILAEILNNFRWKNIKENKKLFLLLLAVLIWGCGWYAAQPYIYTLAIQYLGFSEGQVGIIQVVPMAIGMLLSIPIGILSDKWGRKKMSIILVGIMVLGAIVFAFVKPGVSMIMLMAYLTLLFGPLPGWYVNYKSWARDFFPEERRAQFAGITLLFVVTIPMVIGSQIGSWCVSGLGVPTVIDGNAGFIPTPPMYAVAAVIMALSIIPMLFIKQQKNEDIK